MKRLLVLVLMFSISLNASTQKESISLKSSSEWTSSGEIRKIGKEYIQFKPLVSTPDAVMFKNSINRLTAPYDSKRGIDGFYKIKTNDVNVSSSSNDFKIYLTNYETDFNLYEDKIGFIEMKLSKFRKLQLTARWMSLFGAVVGTVGAISTANNPSTNFDPQLFAYGGAVLSGLGLIIDLVSFSKLKFEKNYKSYDEKTKTYSFD